nr:hypothetical protein [Dehalococcoidales bacterium]
MYIVKAYFIAKTSEPAKMHPAHLQYVSVSLCLRGANVPNISIDGGMLKMATYPQILVNRNNSTTATAWGTIHRALFTTVNTIARFHRTKPNARRADLREHFSAADSFYPAAKFNHATEIAKQSQRRRETRGTSPAPRERSSFRRRTGEIG